MTSNLRGRLAGRLLAAVVLLAGGLVLAPAPAAYACDCSSQTVAQQIAAADAVFSGVVDGPAEAVPGVQRVVYEVRVERVYRGAVDAPRVEVATAAQGSACGLPDLPRNRPVLFFADASGAQWRVNSCGGTGPATPRLVTRVEDRLGAGEPVEPVAAEPREAVFTPVADGEPARFTRVAAPGLALVIVGLLGLLLVRRLGGR